MNKKNGFTLVEIIAIVVLIGIIGIMVVPKVTTLINELKTKGYNTAISTIKDATKVYTHLKTNQIDKIITANSYFGISVGELQIQGLLDIDLVNTSTNQEISTLSGVKITKTGDKYNYEYVDAAASNLFYITEGLVLQYDGVYNSSATSHNESATTWKDLSGNNRNGTITGGTWSTNYLNFDGNDWVSIGLLNQNTYTIDVVASQNVVVDSLAILIGNYEGGGYGITFRNGYASSHAYISGYKYATSPTISVINHIDSYVGTYNNEVLKLYQNKTIKKEIETVGNVGIPSGNTIMAIGVNPRAASPNDGQFFNGKVYALRVYNRALTDAEIKHNYDIDKLRFGL